MVTPLSMTLVTPEQLSDLTKTTGKFKHRSSLRMCFTDLPYPEYYIAARDVIQSINPPASRCCNFSPFSCRRYVVLNVTWKNGTSCHVEVNKNSLVKRLCRENPIMAQQLEKTIKLNEKSPNALEKIVSRIIQRIKQARQDQQKSLIPIPPCRLSIGSLRNSLDFDYRSHLAIALTRPACALISRIQDKSAALTEREKFIKFLLDYLKISIKDPKIRYILRNNFLDALAEQENERSLYSFDIEGENCTTREILTRIEHPEEPICAIHPQSDPKIIIEYNEEQDEFITVPLATETLEINEYQVGVSWSIGRRDEMEDEHLACAGQFKSKDITYFFEIAGGVFDGHSGDGAAKFVKANLLQYLITALELNNQEEVTHEGIIKAIKECCIQLDKGYATYALDNPGQEAAGTTVSFLLFFLNGIFSVTVGDSRIVLTKENHIVAGSEDAMPDKKKYLDKIKKLGGCVESVKGIPRVNGRIAVAQAIGDHAILGSEGICCMSPEPEVIFLPLAQFQGGYAVVACDGLSEVATRNEVGKAIIKMAAQGESAEQMSSRLVKAAIEQYPSKDNVTVMVIKIPSAPSAPIEV